MEVKPEHVERSTHNRKMMTIYLPSVLLPQKTQIRIVSRAGLWTSPFFKIVVDSEGINGVEGTDIGWTRLRTDVIQLVFDEQKVI
jgi:hypothetical protein